MLPPQEQPCPALSPSSNVRAGMAASATVIPVLRQPRDVTSRLVGATQAAAALVSHVPSRAGGLLVFVLPQLPHTGRDALV